MICKKDRSRISSRKTRRLRGNTETDGSQSSKALAQAARFIMFRRIREEKENPYTTHPLSFEEFDSILDQGTSLGIIEKTLRWHYRSRHEWE